MRARRLALFLLSCVAILLIALSITSIVIASTVSSNVNDCNHLDCNAGADLDTFPLPEVGSARGGPGSENGIQFRGVSLSGAEMPQLSELARQGIFIPFDDDATLFIYKGMNTFRIPIVWEYWADIDGNIQTLSNYYIRVKRVIQQLLARNATVIIDLHNYMRYHPSDVNLILNLLNTFPEGNDIIGTGRNAPSNVAIARIWREMAFNFPMPNIIFSLMNAPHDVPIGQVRSYIAIAIEAIRTAEKQVRISAQNPHLILVDGGYFSRIDTWFLSQPFTQSNAFWFSAPIIDPANKVAISVHQYFDKDGSGSGRYVDNECLTLNEIRTSNNQSLNFDRYWSLFKDWVISHKVKIFISEFGVPDTPQCREVMNHVLTQWESFPFSQENESGLIGWTVWHGGHSGSFWGQDSLSLDAGGRANLLMWDNVLYERYLPTFPLPIPELTNNRIALTIINNSPLDLMFIYGYVPFQFKGNMSIGRAGGIGFLYSNNNSTQPSDALEIQFIINNDTSKILTFRFSETGQIIVDNPISLLTIDGNFAQGCIGCTVIVS